MRNIRKKKQKGVGIFLLEENIQYFSELLILLEIHSSEFSQDYQVARQKLEPSLRCTGCVDN